MVARAYTVAFEGVEARIVEVQCAVTPGMPSFSIVGLPDKAVSEARERVRAALTALAIALPSKRITVNLSPADLPKEGSHFDLPMALALLAALDIIPREDVEATVALGELSLDGRLVPVLGALPAAMAAAEEDRQLLCPLACGAEAAWVGATPVIAAANLADVIRHFTGQAPLSPAATRRSAHRTGRPRPARCEGPGTRQTRAGNCRRRAASPADGRLARVGKVDAGRADAGHPAAAVGGRGTGNLDDPLAVGAADRRRHFAHPALPRTASHRVDGGHRRRRARRETGRDQPRA